MDDVLKSHPDLAPEVTCGVLSRALTAARADIADLEHQLKDKALALKDTQTLYENERASGKKLRDTLQDQYLQLRRKETTLKEGQDELRRNTETLRAQYDELRTTETDVEERRREIETQRAKAHLQNSSELQEKETRLDNWRREVEAQMETREIALSKGRRLLEEKMEGFKEMTETLVRDTKAKAENLQVHLRATVAERGELQQALEAVKFELTAKTETCTTLSEATRTLEEKSINAQEWFDSALSDEIGKRLEAEKALADARASLTSTIDEFAQYRNVREGVTEELQGRISAINAEYARLEVEVQELRARAKQHPDTNTTSDADAAKSESVNNIPETETLVAPTEWIAVLRELHGKLNEARRQRTECEVANKDLESTVNARDVQLRSQREKSQAKIFELEAEVQDLLSAAAASESEHTKLMGTLKQCRVEISELKASWNTAKAETVKLRKSSERTEKEKDRQYNDLKARYTTLYEQYETLSTAGSVAVAAADSNSDAAQNLPRELELEVLKKENEALRETNGKLREMNKNLQSSVLRAGAQAKEELQKAAYNERVGFTSANKALAEENTRLRAELDSYKHRSQPVSNPNVPESSMAANARIFAQSQTVGVKHQTQRQTSDEPELPPCSQPTVARSPSEERSLYVKFMRRFPYPADRPAFDRIEPIHKAADNALSPEIFVNSIQTGRRSLHCPKRSLWCGGGNFHVLVFAPTHEYFHPNWVNTSRMVANCGQTFDFFMNQGGFVYYVGIYTVHSLREVHPPGATISPDVSKHAITRAMQLHERSPGDINNCFPDGKIRTECFGLQCVGFDAKVYAALRAKFESAGQKRKAGPEDPRIPGRNKLQKV